jgi:hypothetical protein
MKIDPKDLASTWVVESEQAGLPGLVGTVVRIEIQQINPMIRRAVITPNSGRLSDEQYGGIFGRIKPSVVMIQGDVLLSSLGIMSRRVK